MAATIKIKSALVRCTMSDVFSNRQIPLINKYFIQKDIYKNEFLGRYPCLSDAVTIIGEMYTMTHAGMLYQLSGNLDADDYHFALELQVAAADDLFYSPLHLKENVIYYVRESNGILGPFVVDIFAKKQKFTDAIEKQILYVPCKVQNYNQIVEPINEVA